MMKQLAQTFLLTLLMSMVGAKAFAQTFEMKNADGKNIYYGIMSGTEAVVSSPRNDYYSGDIVIPESVTYNGVTYPVTRIEFRAFNYCYSLTSVTIPNSVTCIGNMAFSGCSKLKNIYIPSSVIDIGEYAFSGTAWLENQPDGVVYAGKVVYTYKGTTPSNTSIVIKEGTLGIADKAFLWCSWLTSVTIPNSVTSIGSYAFNNTAWYKNQPDGVVYAGKVAIGYRGALPSNNSIVLQDGTLGIADEAFFPMNNTNLRKLVSVTIPNSVTFIGGEAFSECYGLTSVNIPNSVIRIGDRAFRRCDLTSITIPNSVTSIGSQTFESCKSLANISVESGNAKFDSRNNCNAIIATASNTLVAGCKNTIIPNSVTTIGPAAFYSCGLTSIIIPNSVTIIDALAFSGCNLASVTIPNFVTSIGNSAFCYCNLTSVNIPNSVTSIGDYAFFCSGLTSVTVGMETPVSIASYTFSNRANATLYVPYGSKASYEKADYWKEFKEIVELGQNTGRINFDENATTQPVYTAGEKGDVSMRRTIKAGEWNTIVLPFTLTRAKAEEIFGEDVLLAEFTGFNTTYEDEDVPVPTSITINLARYELKATKPMTGGKPFLIKTTKNIEYFEVDDVTLFTDVTDVTKSDQYDISGKLTGTLVKCVIPNDGLFISGNQFWYSTGMTNVKAFRCWFELGPVLDKETDFSSRIILNFEGEATGISSMDNVQSKMDDAVYDLQGRRVAKPGKGIYIKGGKKITVK